MSKAQELYENAVIYLIRRERFYAEMLSRVNKIFTKDSDFVPTAGVEITSKGINLYLNEYFVLDQSIPSLAAILKHECEHPMRNHFERGRSLEPSLREDDKNESLLDRFKKHSKAYNLNIAQDYAINQNIEGLPKKFRVFDKKGNPLKDKEGNPVEFSPALVEDLIEAYPEKNISYFESMEYYYSILKEETEQQQTKEGTIVVSLDNHDMLDDSLNNIDPEFAKNIVGKVVNEAKNALSSEEAGSLPGHLKILIEKLNTPSKNWKQELRIFKANCSASEIEETRKRRNRRYGLLYPGKRTKNTTHIVVVVDSSGSITEKELTQFLSEIDAISKAGTKITYIECDSVVQYVQAFDKNKKPEIKGRGGTLFKPVFDLVESAAFTKKYGKVNGLVYFTDGENFDKELACPKYKVLWALLPSGASRYEWGKKIWITTNT